MNHLITRPLAFAAVFALALPGQALCQEDADTPASAPEMELSIELAVEAAEAAPAGVEERLGRLEEQMDEQRELLERVALRLEAFEPGDVETDAGSISVSLRSEPSPAVDLEALPEVDLESITSFGAGPIRVKEGEQVEEAVAFGAPVVVEGEVLGDAITFDTGSTRLRRSASPHLDRTAEFLLKRRNLQDWLGMSVA